MPLAEGNRHGGRLRSGVLEHAARRRAYVKAHRPALAQRPLVGVVGAVGARHAHWNAVAALEREIGGAGGEVAGKDVDTVVVHAPLLAARDVWIAVCLALQLAHLLRREGG